MSMHELEKIQRILFNGYGRQNGHLLQMGKNPVPPKKSAAVQKRRKANKLASKQRKSSK